MVLAKRIERSLRVVSASIKEIKESLEKQKKLSQIGK
jgi:hypothetical protein